MIDAELARVIVVGLAAWRVSVLFVAEDGPARIFERLRHWARVVEIDLADLPLGPPVEEEQPSRPFLGGLLSCVWCLSVWMTALFWLLWEVHWAIPGIAAAAAIAVIVEGRSQNG